MPLHGCIHLANGPFGSVTVERSAAAAAAAAAWFLRSVSVNTRSWEVMFCSSWRPRVWGIHRVAFYLHILYTQGTTWYIKQRPWLHFKRICKKWRHIKIPGRLNGFPEMHLLQILLDGVHPRPWCSKRCHRLKPRLKSHMDGKQLWYFSLKSTFHTVQQSSNYIFP